MEQSKKNVVNSEAMNVRKKIKLITQFIKQSTINYSKINKFLTSSPNYGGTTKGVKQQKTKKKITIKKGLSEINQ